jgi:hypothetical protein
MAMCYSMSIGPERNVFLTKEKSVTTVHIVDNPPGRDPLPQWFKNTSEVQKPRRPEHYPHVVRFIGSSEVPWNIHNICSHSTRGKILTVVAEGCTAMVWVENLKAAEEVVAGCQGETFHITDRVRWKVLEVSIWDYA